MHDVSRDLPIAYNHLVLQMLHLSATMPGYFNEKMTAEFTMSNSEYPLTVMLPFDYNVTL